MTDDDALATLFERNRPQLRAVAYRMLGSLAEADDAVQEAWLRLSRADTSDIANRDAWLTTVVGRVCLDMLRSRKSRREDPLDPQTAEPTAHVAGPEQDALLADSVGLALLVVLETLTPAERLAFVLHDMFGVAFDEIAPIVDRTPTAARQLASRARRRVRSGTASPQPDAVRQRQIVDAFLTASSGGDITTLLSLLDPGVILRSDRAAAQLGGAPEIRGKATVAEFFSGRAQGASPALVDGLPGVAVAVGGELQLALCFTVRGGLIVGIDAIAEPAALGELEITVLDR